MPQTSAPTPRPQSARRTGQRMDFAPRRGNVAPQPRPAAPATAKPAASATKPTSRPAAKSSPRPVSRRPAVKPAPKPVSNRPAQTAPRPTTPRRPALITSAREAMNAHARALREAQLEAQLETHSTTQPATQPAAQRSAHLIASSAPAPDQGIAAPTSPRSAHNLHHAPAPTAPERPRVTPMPTHLCVPAPIRSSSAPARCSAPSPAPLLPSSRLRSLPRLFTPLSPATPSPPPV